MRRSFWAGLVAIAAIGCAGDGPVGTADMALPGDCTDGVRDGDETDVDCGGACGDTCTNGQACAAPKDCRSLQCSKGVCDGKVLDFAAPVNVSTAPDRKPIALAAGDLDNDHDVDLVVCALDTHDVVSLRNDGHAQFAVAGMPFFLDWQPWAVALGDLDGDGTIDAAVGRNSPPLELLQGNGDGTFGKRAQVTIGGSTRQPVIADLDGDGDPDIAVAGGDKGSKRVHFVRRTAGWAFEDFGAVGEGLSDPDGLALGDLDADGRADLVVADVDASSLTVLRSLGAGMYDQSALPGALGPNVVRVGVLDDKVGSDIVFANWNAPAPQSLGVYVDALAMPARPPDLYRAGSRADGVALADYNGDGRLDVAADCLTEEAVTVYLGLGDGTFATPGFRFEGGPSPTDLVSADFDGDTRPDLAFANEDQTFVTVLLNAVK